MIVVFVVQTVVGELKRDGGLVFVIRITAIKRREELLQPCSRLVKSNIRCQVKHACDIGVQHLDLFLICPCLVEFVEVRSVFCDAKEGASESAHFLEQTQI